MAKTYKTKRIVIAMAVVILSLLPVTLAKAEAASAVSFGTINYEQLTLQVYNNNNSIVFYSIDNSVWMEVEGAYSSTSKAYTMDISWIKPDSDYTLYFKGDIVKTVKSITLPMQNSDFSVVFDKADGTFTFDSAEEANRFEWRKSTDYYWRTVELDENSASYASFLNVIDKLKLSGTTIIIRLPQVMGTGSNNVGMRQSKEVAVNIPARGAAPTLKVNSSKLTINTTTLMEYYDADSDLWIECTSSMKLEEIAPEVMYENGAMVAKIKIRKAATASSQASKTTTLTIPAQTAAPVIGDRSADVTYYFMNSKLILQFNKASSTQEYEYTIVKASGDFDYSTASWKTVKSSDVITLSSSAAPKDSTIYVRKKGYDADSGSESKLVLSSAISSFEVTY